MAYGQTGSGKTHSMLGPPLPPAAAGDGGAIPIDASSGLITRIADDLFGQVGALSFRPRLHFNGGR